MMTHNSQSLHCTSLTLHDEPSLQDASAKMVSKTVSFFLTVFKESHAASTEVRGKTLARIQGGVFLYCLLAEVASLVP